MTTFSRIRGRLLGAVPRPHAAFLHAYFKSRSEDPRPANSRRRVAFSSQTRDFPCWLFADHRLEWNVKQSRLVREQPMLMPCSSTRSNHSLAHPPRVPCRACGTRTAHPARRSRMDGSSRKSRLPVSYKHERVIFRWHARHITGEIGEKKM